MKCPRTQQECYNPECGKTTGICATAFVPDNKYVITGGFAVPIQQETEDLWDEMWDCLLSEGVKGLKSKFTIQRRNQ